MPQQVYREVLRDCSAPAVAAEFDALGPEAKGLMLQALQAATERLAWRFMAQLDPEAQDAMIREAEQVMLRGIAPAGVGDASDPLVRALRIWSPGLATNAMAAFVRRQLRSWGLVRPSSGLYAGPSRTQCPGVDDGADGAVPRPEPGPVRIGWDALRPIGAADLPLFAVARGGVLRGTLVADALVSSAVTTLLQDDAGAVVVVALHNALPGGARGREAEALTRRLFPNGAAICVAEPFYTIFPSGRRGVRVDSPGDVRVRPPAGDVAVHAAALVVAGAWHAAAAEFWAASRVRDTAHGPARLLANRARACLQQGLWAAAGADAAAALLLEPERGHAWRQYAAAMLGLGQPDVAQQAKAVRDRANAPATVSATAARAVLEAALGLAAPEGAGDAAPHDPWRAGTAAYRTRRFGDAAALYTSAMAVLPAAETAARLLEHAAVCALRINALHDAVAAASASLRLRPGRTAPRDCLVKGLALLGEEAAADLAAAGAPAPQAVVARARAVSQSGYSDRAVLECLDDGVGALLPDWVARDALEIADFGAKGRGVRATRIIRPGEVLLVSRARISACCAPESDGFPERTADARRPGSLAQLSAQAVHTAASDGLLRAVLTFLDDGMGTAKRSVPEWDDVLHRLSGRVLPLLRQHHDYLVAAPQLSSERIAGVLNTNCFGETLEFGSEANRTELHPALSVVNHSSLPTCRVRTLGSGPFPVRCLVADCEIPKGEEVTILYNGDPRVLEQQWGIRD